MVKTFITSTVGRVLSMRVERTYSGVQKPTNIFCDLCLLTNYSGATEPQCQATPIEFGSPHEAICVGFVEICLQILHSY
jgi:hypothetical protein